MWMIGKTKRKAMEPRIFSIKANFPTFVKHLDHIQEQLEALASIDNLLSGMCDAWMYKLLC